MTPASDLAEGLLNNADRPPVFADGGKEELYAGGPLVHFNEVDECAGMDALVTNRCWTALGLDPSTTLHDVRWGDHYKGDGASGDLDTFVWVFQISGAAPANHFTGGYAGAKSERQPAMYFPLGGGSLKGISKPGEVVWSRVFVEGGKLHADLGRADYVAVADHARGAARGEPEPDDGAASRKSPECGLCAVSGDGRQGAVYQSCDACGAGHCCASVRRGTVRIVCGCE
jgi:hypothetical protein